jgi:zinc protease
MKFHIIVSLAAIASLQLATSALAQQPATPSPTGTESLQGVKLKNKAPVNPKTLRVTLPKAQEATLSNGVRVALLEDHKLPTFSLSLLLAGGGLADPADKRGLAMVTASLLREGTKQRSSRDIAEQLAKLGAGLSAAASPSSGETSIGVNGLIEHADAILALWADVVLNPAFPDSELQKYKARLLSQLQYQRSLPNFVAQEQFFRAVYGEHPASYIVPPESVLQRLTREDLAAYHTAYYRPTSAIVIAYGDITLKDLTRKLEHALASWPKGEPGVVSLPKTPPSPKARVLLVDRPSSVQTSLWVGSLGIDRRSDDYFGVLLMNHILGGGPASRLFTHLREEKGYTYGVYSSFTGSKFPGVMLATMDVRTAVTADALKDLMAELQRIATEPVPEQELQNAKRALVGRFALSLDSPQSLVSNLATQKIYELPADYWETYPQRVEAITAADVRRVAQKYLDPSRLQLVAVGDSASVKPVLEKYGTIESPPSTSGAP